MTLDYAEALIAKSRRLANEVRDHLKAHANCTKGLPKRAIFDSEGHVVMTIPIETDESRECHECESRLYAEKLRNLNAVNEQLERLAKQDRPLVVYRAYTTRKKRIGHRWEKLP